MPAAYGLRVDAVTPEARRQFEAMNADGGRVAVRDETT